MNYRFCSVNHIKGIFDKYINLFLYLGSLCLLNKSFGNYKGTLMERKRKFNLF